MRQEARRHSKNPMVRALALKILEQEKVKSHDFLSEAKAIAEFVRDNVRYVRDIEGVEQLHNPLYMIKQVSAGTAQGDCDDMSLLLATLLLSVGHSPYFAIVRYRDVAGPFNHIYVTEYEKNWGPKKKKRLVMDTIMKDREIGFEVPYKSGKEIMV